MYTKRCHAPLAHRLSCGLSSRRRRLFARRPRTASRGWLSRRTRSLVAAPIKKYAQIPIEGALVFVSRLKKERAHEKMRRCNSIDIVRMFDSKLSTSSSHVSSTGLSISCSRLMTGVDDFCFGAEFAGNCGRSVGCPAGTVTSCAWAIVGRTG